MFFDHPDPTGEQLRCMQRQVLKMLEGSATGVEPAYGDRVIEDMSAKSVTSADWKQLVEAGHVYIWLDYCSVRGGQHRPLTPPSAHPSSLSYYTMHARTNSRVCLAVSHRFHKSGSTTMPTRTTIS